MRFYLKAEAWEKVWPQRYFPNERDKELVSQ